MNDNFNRAPGAGRIRSPPADPGFVGTAGDPNTSTTFYNQTVSPLRQPRTSPSFTESPHNDTAGEGGKPPNKLRQTATRIVKGLILSMFSISCKFLRCHLLTVTKHFLGHLSTSPGSFESDIGYISDTINSWVNTEETLNELVDLIFTQSTTIPNFSYTGARLCNYLSHHLAISPPSGNFRQLLLKRCQVEYQQRDAAARGDAEAQKKLHSFVLFLGELYLNLEVKSAKGSPDRAHVLLSALNDLMNTLFSHPVDTNLICAVKLLKLTGSVLEDEWKESGKAHMDELIQRIETILLDATCSRDVRQMLLKLVELRSSDWGRVRDAVPASNATPDNDPNYFMNEPTFYTEDGIAFTAADPEFAEKYQEMLARQDYFHDTFGENGNEAYDDSDDELEPEMAEAFERFYLETEMKKQQRQQPPNH
uniref:Polyadenylate-binding protein-interacting protein 1 n=1 Tax=Takifugu rubripes TaxID=31033 RepID=A0A674P525_TAKRU